MSNHLKYIKPVTLEAIRAWSDGNAFDSIFEFVRDETNSIADRVEALRIMVINGMGLTLEEARGGFTDEGLAAACLKRFGDTME
jgi:hypothetical protein